MIFPLNTRIAFYSYEQGTCWVVWRNEQSNKEKYDRIVDNTSHLSKAGWSIGFARVKISSYYSKFLIVVVFSQQGIIDRYCYCLNTEKQSIRQGVCTWKIYMHITFQNVERTTPQCDVWVRFSNVYSGLYKELMLGFSITFWWAIKGQR